MRYRFSKMRRGVIRRGIFGFAAATTAMSAAWAATQAREKVSEDDPLAKQLMYVDDASQASAVRTAGAVCRNCRFYQTGKTVSGRAEQPAYGPCTIFAGKLVNARGWCLAWSPREA